MSSLGGTIYAPPYYLDEVKKSSGWLPSKKPASKDAPQEADQCSKILHEDQGKEVDGDGLARSLIYTCLQAINKNYGTYISVLTSDRAALEVGYDSLNLGLSGAATAFTPPLTKTVLSGLSTFFQGQRTSIDKNLFDEKAIFALTSIMEQRRTDVLSEFRKTLVDHPKTYTVGDALLDLEDLYRAGTLLAALQASYLNQDQGSDGAGKKKKGGGSHGKDTKGLIDAPILQRQRPRFPASTSPYSDR